MDRLIQNFGQPKSAQNNLLFLAYLSDSDSEDDISRVEKARSKSPGTLISPNFTLISPGGIL